MIMSRPLQVYLDDDDLARLETWSRAKGWTKSQVVRAAIRSFTRPLERDPLLAASGMIDDLPPDGSQRFAAALKRLAKMLVGEPKASLGSYHATQGTVRPVPAKSMEGASASFVGSMLSDAGKPCVTHAPFLNARTKIC